MPGRSRRRERIFVLIASYRDVECQWTIKDLFEQARDPDAVTVGVCWQADPVADADCFGVVTRPAQVRTVHAHPRESLGVGWARAQAARLWQGEAYVLLIDSHMRFAEHWDARLVGQLARCRSRFPVLTTYPWGYTPPRTLGEGVPPRLAAQHFDADGILRYAPMTDGAAAPAEPRLQAFCAGGFQFSRAAVLREVPHDPHVYFVGEEVTRTVRLWTHGWDFFAPGENLVFHNYDRTPRTGRLHWDDHQDWTVRARRSYQRIRHLLGMEISTDPEVTADLERYGLGRRRSLAQYERFAGVDFKNRLVSDAAAAGRCDAAGVKFRGGRPPTPRVAAPVWRPALTVAQPRIALYHGFFTPAECARLIALSRPRLERSGTVDPQSGASVHHEARTSSAAWFRREENPFIAALERRMAELTGYPIVNGEGLQVLRYGIGGEYRPHFDFFDPAQPGSAVHLAKGGQRVATLIVYLNAVDAGGETIFPSAGVTVAPVPGSALLFTYDGEGPPDPRTLHGGTPVRRGEKWIATKWIRRGPHR